MGHNGSWISRNASEPRNASGAEAAGANRSALGEFGEAQLYRQFTTTVQVVIFIGSLLGYTVSVIRVLSWILTLKAPLGML